MSSSDSSKNANSPTSDEKVWLKYLTDLRNLTISGFDIHDERPSKKIAYDYLVDFQRLHAIFLSQTTIVRNSSVPRNRVSDELTRRQWNMQVNALFDILISESSLIGLPDKKNRADLIEGINKLNVKVIKDLDLITTEKNAVSSIIETSSGN